MTDLEKTFSALAVLLCQQATDLHKQISGLRQELAERPTREQLHAAEQAALRAGDELRMVRHELEAERAKKHKHKGKKS